MTRFLGVGILFALLAFPNTTSAQSNTRGQERNTNTTAQQRYERERYERARYEQYRRQQQQRGQGRQKPARRGEASLYLGLQGGGHQIASGFVDISSVDNFSFSGGLLTGFEYMFPSRIFMALEAYGGLQDYRFEDFRSEYYFGANALLGWRPLPGLRFHLFGGPQWMDLRYEPTRSTFFQDPALAGEIANASYEDFAIGWRVGGGVALSLLSPNWRTRADYSYAQTTRYPPLLAGLGVKNQNSFENEDVSPKEASISVLTTHMIMFSLVRVF